MPIPRLITEMSELAGKTILAAKPDDPSYESVTLYFTDGTAAVFCPEVGWDGDRGVELGERDLGYSEMLAVGFITQDEFDEWHASEEKRRQQAEAAFQERRRQEYERMKREFEGG